MRDFPESFHYRDGKPRRGRIIVSQYELAAGFRYHAGYKEGEPQTGRAEFTVIARRSNGDALVLDPSAA